MNKHLFKKILTLLMCLTLVFSMVACGDKSANQSGNKSDDNSKPATAEAVIEKALSAENVENIKMDMTLKVDMGINLKQMMLDQGATEADIQAAIDAGMLTEETLNMNIAADMAMTMEGSGDNYCMTGDLKAQVMGQSIEEEIKSYVVKNDDNTVTTYTYDTEDECWYKTTAEADDEDAEELAGILSSMGDYKQYIKSSKIVETKDGICTLEVTIDLSKLMNEDVTGALDGMLGGLSSSTEGIYDAMDEMTMTLKVDEKTGVLTGLYVDCTDMIKDVLASSFGDTTGADYGSYVTVTECSLEIEASNHGNVNVTIPDEVLDAEELSVEDIFDDEDEDEEDDDDDSIF